jgi:aminoglycoside 6'-N-acetyltransferase
MTTTTIEDAGLGRTAVVVGVCGIRFSGSSNGGTGHLCRTRLPAHNGASARFADERVFSATDVPRQRASNSGYVRHKPIESHGVVLRPTTSDDLALLRSIFIDPGFYERWGGKPLTDEEINAKYLGARSPQVECFVVEGGSDSLGFVQYHVSDDGGEGGGMDLVLLPWARGRGVGTAVVRAMVRFVKTELRWRRFTVDPEVSNPRGVSFWHKAGFIPVRVVDDDLDREPYWLMEWPQLDP